jgi:hypothetical protein
MHHIIRAFKLLFLSSTLGPLTLINFLQPVFSDLRWKGHLASQPPQAQRSEACLEVKRNGPNAPRLKTEDNSSDSAPDSWIGWGALARPGPAATLERRGAPAGSAVTLACRGVPAGSAVILASRGAPAGSATTLPEVAETRGGSVLGRAVAVICGAASAW